MSKAAIDRLTGLGQTRVWSVIITIFGDAILPRGGVGPSAALSELTSEIGVKPEAFRVALSRLTKDGWIERSKEGRHSFYRLSTKGYETFAPASSRIYAAGPAKVETWQIVVSDTAPEDPFVELAPRTYIGPPAPATAGAVVLRGELAQLPDWARARMAEADVVSGYAALSLALSDVARMVESAPPAPLTAAAIRTLIVHQWRRLLLRHGDWPAEVFPEDWQGEVCRAQVHAMLAALDPAAKSWMDAAFSSSA